MYFGRFIQGIGAIRWGAFCSCERFIASYGLFLWTFVYYPNFNLYGAVETMASSTITVCKAWRSQK